MVVAALLRSVRNLHIFLTESGDAEIDRTDHDTCGRIARGHACLRQRPTPSRQSCSRGSGVVASCQERPADPGGARCVVRSVTGRYGTRTPSIEQAVQAFARQRGEIIVPSSAAAANILGLSTQVPVRSVYLTSGRSRFMSFGRQVVELRHVPRWQLVLADRPAGVAIRALAWLGLERADTASRTLKCMLSPPDFSELVSAAPQLLT